MHSNRRPWSDAGKARIERRRRLRELYPDDDLCEAADAYVDNRAPMGFCKCGLRNPCFSCMDEVAKQSLVPKHGREVAVGRVDRKGM